MSDIAPTPSATALQPALGHVMDARLDNLDQEIFVFDPSPDVDSALEHAAALLHCPAQHRPHHVAALMTLLRKVLESNRAEGGHELQAAGYLDPLIKDLHTQGQRSTLTVKQAAAHLRGPLQVIHNRPDGVEFFRQACKVKDVLAVMDPDTVRGRGMRSQLGDARHDLLLSLLPPEQIGRAA